MATAAMPSMRPRRTRRWLIAGGVALVALCIAAGIAGVVLAADRLATTHYRLDGDAMSPCFSDGATVAATRLDATGRRALRRGDIVVFEAPVAASKPYFKRVIAVGGDTIAIRDRQVILNGVVLAEPYVEQPTNSRYPLGSAESYLVPTDTLFVLGDNRNNSSDSRAFGPVALDRVTHTITTPCTVP